MNGRPNQLIEAGLWLKMSGDVDGARRLFEQALKLEPANARARELLGQAPAETEAVPEELRDVPVTRTDPFSVPLPRLFPEEPSDPAAMPEDWWSSGDASAAGVVFAPASARRPGGPPPLGDVARRHDLRPEPDPSLGPVSGAGAHPRATRFAQRPPFHAHPSARPAPRGHAPSGNGGLRSAPAGSAAPSAPRRRPGRSRSAAPRGGSRRSGRRGHRCLPTAGPGRSAPGGPVRTR